jgi:hypothetical protein
VLGEISLKEETTIAKEKEASNAYISCDKVHFSYAVGMSSFPNHVLCP